MIFRTSVANLQIGVFQKNLFAVEKKQAGRRAFHTERQTYSAHQHSGQSKAGLLPAVPFLPTCGVFVRFPGILCHYLRCYS